MVAVVVPERGANCQSREDVAVGGTVAGYLGAPGRRNTGFQILYPETAIANNSGKDVRERSNAANFCDVSIF